MFPWFCQRFSTLFALKMTSCGGQILKFRYWWSPNFCWWYGSHHGLWVDSQIPLFQKFSSLYLCHILSPMIEYVDWIRGCLVTNSNFSWALCLCCFQAPDLFRSNLEPTFSNLVGPWICLDLLAVLASLSAPLKKDVSPAIHRKKICGWQFFQVEPINLAKDGGGRHCGVGHFESYKKCPPWSILW